MSKALNTVIALRKRPDDSDIAARLPNNLGASPLKNPEQSLSFYVV